MRTFNCWLFWIAFIVSLQLLLSVFSLGIALMITAGLGKITILFGLMLDVFFFLIWLLFINLPAWLIMRHIVRKEGLPENSEESVLSNIFGVFYVKR